MMIYLFLALAPAVVAFLIYGGSKGRCSCGPALVDRKAGAIMMYGIWSQAGEWWTDTSGVVFHTPDLDVAVAQLATIKRRGEPKYVMAFGREGKPISVTEAQAGPSEHKAPPRIFPDPITMGRWR